MNLQEVKRMSWTNELYKIYEYNCSRVFEDGEPMMLPVSHSTANAQIEIAIDEDGNFMSAGTVEKSDAETIIPVTEDSGARSSGICPMPLADKLVYIAGDYSSYASGKRADNSGFYGAYMEQLSAWRDGEHSHPAVRAIHAYLAKCTLMKDLIGAGILQINSDTGKLLEKAKIAGIAQEDAFVRFIVRYAGGRLESKTWEDLTLYKSFEKFNGSIMENKQLCYARGTVEAVTYKHPSKVRHSGDKAKLISSNDESGFTYRGRFRGKEEALSVSYDFSQKAHNALKWLIQKQGMRFDSLTLIVWASALQELPPVEKSVEEWNDPFAEEAEKEQIPDTMQGYLKLVQRMIFGYRDSLKPHTKVMLMGLDAATTGRLSIAVYAELEDSQFLANLEKWHTETAWMCWSSKHKTSCINSFSVYELIRSAYGMEQNGLLQCDDKLLRDTTLRLLPCITEGRKIPRDLVRSLCQRASNPLAYDKSYNHRIVLETACAMVRKEYLDYRKGELTMAFDPNETDRSYLFGCLLAIADKAESDTYEKEDHDKRITNARRYWSAFASRPSQTWMLIEERLRPYLDKLDGGKRINYEKLMGEITSKMRPADFADNSRLSPLYLLGYHHYNAKLYEKKTNKED